MFPKSVRMFLVPARGTTTFHAQIGPKCSGAPSGGGSVPPCGYQDNSQTLSVCCQGFIHNESRLDNKDDRKAVILSSHIFVRGEDHGLCSRVCCS